jgi:hypothetical protein
MAQLCCAVPDDLRLRKVTVLLSEAEYGRFERFCEAFGHKKSTLAARLIRTHLDQQGFEVQQRLPGIELEWSKNAEE